MSKYFRTFTLNSLLGLKAHASLPLVSRCKLHINSPDSSVGAVTGHIQDSLVSSTVTDKNIFSTLLHSSLEYTQLHTSVRPTRVEEGYNNSTVVLRGDKKGTQCPGV
jgi:hypothetical protein